MPEIKVCSDEDALARDLSEWQAAHPDATPEEAFKAGYRIADSLWFESEFSGASQYKEWKRANA